MADNVPTNALIPLAGLLAEIAKAPPLPQLLDHILDAACRLAHADTGIIGLYDPATDTMRSATVHQSMQAHTAESYARGEGLGGHVLATGTAYHGRYGDLPRPSVVAIHEHAALGLPILWDRQLLGYFGVSLAPPRKFRPTQIELLELIARIAAIAIEHARREEEERRRSLRFELIARIAADIHQELELDVLLQRAADAIHEVLLFPNVDIPLIDPDDPGTLVLRIRGGDYKRKIHREDRLTIDRGIMGAALRSRTTLLVNDACNDPRYVCPPGVAPAQAELAVPIRSGDRMLGVLNVESGHAFDDLDRRSLEVIADYLGVAINNAQLFRHARKGAAAPQA